MKGGREMEGVRAIGMEMRREGGRDGRRKKERRKDSIVGALCT